MRRNTIVKLKIRDGENCVACSKPMLDPTLDHIIPKSKGGSNKIENLQLMHFECNTKKGNGDPVLAGKKKRRKGALAEKWKAYRVGCSCYPSQRVY